MSWEKLSAEFAAFAIFGASCFLIAVLFAYAMKLIRIVKIKSRMKRRKLESDVKPTMGADGESNQSDAIQSTEPQDSVKTDRRLKSNVAICISLMVILLVGLLFWPGLYRYSSMSSGDGTYPVRVNRITGSTEWFLGNRGWQLAKEASSRESMTLPKSAVDSLVAELESGVAIPLTSRFGLFSGPFTIRIYNSTEYEITGLEFTTVEELANSKLKVFTYEVRPRFGIGPGEYDPKVLLGTFTSKVKGLRISGAKGYLPK